MVSAKAERSSSKRAGGSNLEHGDLWSERTMKQMTQLVLIYAVLNFVLLPFKDASGQPLQKGQESPKAVVSSPLSPAELRDLRERIEWVQKNYAELDRKILEIGKHTFDISWTMWYTFYLLMGLQVAVLGLLGYGAYRSIRAGLRRSIQTQASSLMREQALDSRMRVRFDLTDTLGQFYEFLPQVPGSQLLNMIIEVGEYVLRDTENLRKEFGEKYENYVLIAKNNLAYLLTLAGQPVNKSRAHSLAQDPYDNAAKFGNDFHWIDTYAWVWIVFAGENVEETQRGRSIIEELLKRPDIPDDWKRRRSEKLRRFLEGRANVSFPVPGC